VTDSLRAKLLKYAKWVLLVLALAYLFQFVRGLRYKGQDPIGAVFETIAHETLQRQWDGLPQMRVGGAGATNLCARWNFEQLWGQCVAIVVEVRDYLPEYQAIIDREVMKLAKQVRRPCALLPTLRLPNEQQLARNLECNDSKRAFKLQIAVASVTVTGEQPASIDRPHRWSISGSKRLKSYYFEGEF
jgi:hypothetical protein